MKKNICPTKLIRPTPTDIFPRQRLFKQLDSMRKRPAIWVTGLPGCGKTTLISSYIEARDISCLWYQIDEDDADETTFFHFMNMAAEKTGIMEPGEPLLSTAEYPAPVSASRYFENFYHLFSIPGIIVFDDYQKIPADSSFHEVIRTGLSKTPKGATVILISRNALPPALIRETLDHRLEPIGWDALRLTEAEVRGITQLRTDETLPEDIAAELCQTTNGWVGGLILMLMKAKADHADLNLLGRYVPEEIFDYFRSEIFHKADSETQDLLLKTVLLPGISVELAEKLTDCPRAGRILSDLCQNNCFTERFFLNEPVYRYHPLFKKFLFLLAKETSSTADLMKLCRKAASILEETDQPEAAISLLHDAGDEYGKAKLIAVYAAAMLAQGKHRLLMEWLTSLSRDILENEPWLLYWMGASHLPFNPALSRHYFRKAFEGFDAQEEAAEALLSWSGIVEAIIFGFEDFTEIDRWIQVAEKLTCGFQNLPEEIEIRVISGMFMALLCRQPDHPDMAAWTERLSLVTQSCTDFNTESLTMVFQLTLHWMFMGDFKRAETAVNWLRQIGLSGGDGLTPTDRLKAGYADAMYCQFSGMHEPCMDMVTECLNISQESDVHILDCALIGQAVSSALNVNDQASAGKWLKEMVSRLNPCKKWEVSQYHFLNVRKALLSNKSEDAVFHAGLSLNLAAEVGFVFPLSFCHLLRAQVMHQSGKHQEARQHLDHASEIAQQTGSRLLEFYVLWSKAWFDLDKKDESSALESLGKALAIGRRQGYLNTFLDQPATTAKLCAKALAAEMEIDYVQEIVRKRGLSRYDMLLILDNWPWNLKIFTLGRFSMVKDGKAIRFSGKAQQKPLELLKALIAFGGREIRTEQMEDTLWPDADGDFAHRAFKTTLHRLRKLLGASDALRLRDGRLTLEQKHCWVDVWAFQRTFGQADAAWDRGKAESEIEKAVELTQKASDLYKGAFLPEEMWNPLFISLRDRLRSKFIRGVAKLGHHWERSGQWERAAECYQRGLEVDNLAEEIYRRLMTCHHQVGLRAEALAVYDRCKNTLLGILGIEPSYDTEILRESILSEMKKPRETPRPKFFEKT